MDVDPPGDDIGKLRDQIHDASKDKAREICDILKVKQCSVFQSLSLLLAQFYRQPQREIAYDRMLLARSRAAGKIRIESIGIEMQFIVPEAVKAQKLLAYQQEMTDFTVFLKSLLAEPIVASGMAVVSQ